MLRVALFEIAEAADELLAGDVVVVGEEEALRGLAGVVDEDVGVRGHAGDGADHVAGIVLVAGGEGLKHWRGHQAYSFNMYSFSADVSCSRSLDVTLRSAARTIPSCANIPRAVPACEMASRAYSTW